MPSRGLASPLLKRASASRAMARACSGVSSTNALIARASSIAARCASASSAAEKRFFKSPSRASVSVSEVRSVIAPCLFLGWAPAASFLVRCVIRCVADEAARWLERRLCQLLRLLLAGHGQAGGLEVGSRETFRHHAARDRELELVTVQQRLLLTRPAHPLASSWPCRPSTS